MGSDCENPALAALGGRIVAQISIGIVVTRDNQVVCCNGAFESMAGLSCEAIEGKPHPFLADGRAEDGCGLDVPLEACLEHALREKSVRVRYDRPDGFPTWNEIQFFQDGAHLIWVHRDITQQLATHELWRRYAFLVDSSRQFMALVDRHYTYALVNASFAGIFNTRPEEINGATGETIWGSALFETMVAPCLDQCFQGEEVHLQRWVAFPGGARRHLDMVYTPYRDKHGEVQHAVFVAWDNTEEKNATDTVHDLNKILEQRVEERTAELQDTMQELEAFNYTIAHDLRTPLHFLKSFTRMLEEESAGQLGESGLYYCSMITQGVAEMQHLIDRLLDFSRLSRKPISMSPCDLNAIVKAAREAVSVDGDITIEIAPLPPCLGDHALLKQVFVNLLGNAIKFTRVSPSPRADVYAEPSAPNTAHICVRDNGIGFHMNHAEAMFAPFKQIHDSAGNPGNGLGLAIVRRIVERHGGSVWAEGGEGAGATFHVQLGTHRSGGPVEAAPPGPKR